MALKVKDKNEVFNKFDSYIRGSFTELPFAEYYVPFELMNQLEAECTNGNPTLNTIQSIVIDMEHHLGYKNNTSIVFLEHNYANNHAGIIEKNERDFSDITIYFNHKYSAINYIAVIAHELSHAYQTANGKPMYIENDLNEFFTDALIAYLGFGFLFLRGMEMKGTDYNVRSPSYSRQTLKLGYLEKEDFHIIMKLIEKLENEKKNNQLLKKELENLRKECYELTPVFNMYYEHVIHLIDLLKYKTDIRREGIKEIKDAFFAYSNSDLLIRINKIPKVVKNADIIKTKECHSLLSKEMSNILKVRARLEKLLKG